MITDEQIKKFRRMVSDREPQGELIESLREQGYSEEDISKIFTAPAYDMRSWQAEEKGFEPLISFRV